MPWEIAPEKYNNTQDPKDHYLDWQFFVERVIKGCAVFNNLIEMCQGYDNGLLVFVNGILHSLVSSKNPSSLYRKCSQQIKAKPTVSQSCC